jgi:hypothetical protein
VIGLVAGHFLNRKATKDLFRGVFRYGKEKGREKWTFQQSGQSVVSISSLKVLA